MNSDDEQRLWEKIDRRGKHECWLWMAATDRKGYGQFKCGGRLRRAHRLVFECEYGPIPKGLFVCHSCDNPPCCHPEHLSIGTRTDNMRDAAQKGRTASGDRNSSRTKPERMARGDRHGNAKLTEDAVRTIREDTRSLRVIAAEYGVSLSLVSQIKLRKIWAHVLG